MSDLANSSCVLDSIKLPPYLGLRSRRRSTNTDLTVAMGQVLQLQGTTSSWFGKLSNDIGILDEREIPLLAVVVPGGVCDARGSIHKLRSPVQTS